MCHCTVIQPIWTDFPAAGAKEEEEEEEEGRGRSIVVFCRYMAQSAKTNIIRGRS